MGDTLSWVEINANFHSFQVDWHDFAKTRKILVLKRHFDEISSANVIAQA